MEEKHEVLRNILRKFENVFQEELLIGFPLRREVDHAIEIEEGVKRPFRPLYQLSPAELVAAKDYVEKLLRSRKIRPSKSPFGAPLLFAKEKGGSLRSVVDYKALNKITKLNSAPIPRIDEMFGRLGKARYFSKLDLKSGFHQIGV